MRVIIILLTSFAMPLSAQDAYHTSLLVELRDNYGLEGGIFLLPDNEEEVLERTTTYGNISVVDISQPSQTFSQSKGITVLSEGNNPWDAGYGIGIINTVSADDLVLVTFWAKQNSSSSQVFVYAEDAIDYEKEFYFPISFTPDWTQYFVAFNANESYNVNRLNIGFHLATQSQNIEIAGMSAINYRDLYQITDLPSSFSPFDYEGRALDSPWRSLADTRIEQIRKSDLKITVVDNAGMPVSDATVKVEMQQHDFGFGSALVTCRFPGNNCYDATYVDKVINIDGKGHGFNECVNENALKWRAWEQEWLGTPDETVGAFRWLHDQGITMRGHNLLWPGSDYLPSDINNNISDIDYLRTRIDERIEEMIAHPELSTIVRDWDILNEITTNRTLEFAFNSDPTLDNGRKLYNEIYTKVREMDPTLELYINDYMAISSGSANLVARYKSFLDELRDDGVPFDGIGFQAHIGSVPNSIPQVEQIFNDFYQRYGKRMKITEYDMNPAVDELIQADYMRDILTLTFSHPGMDAFIIWGFWDGNHWKNNAPIFYEDWTLKPSGEVFIQKVYEEWWTDDTLLSDTNGIAELRPFKGKHTITVTKGGATTSVDIDLLQEQEIEIVLDGTSSTTDIDNGSFGISPNPSDSGSFQIDYPDIYDNISIKIYDANSKLIQSQDSIISGQLIQSELSAGVYLIKIKTDQTEVVKRLIVNK